MSVEVRRAADRFVSRSRGIVSRHSFSFGEHYDPGNIGHGLLLVHNDDLLEPGAGYETHRHADVEILTWVVAGRLAHEDSTGRAGVLTPGTIQRTSAGRGITHSERNASDAEPVRFVQMHLPPDEPGTDPSYEQHPVDLPAGRLVAVASGGSARSPAAVRLGNGSAALHAARLGPSDVVTLPDAAYLHVYVVTGAADLEAAGPLTEGDAARLTGEAPRTLTGSAPGTEMLVWEMGRPPGPVPFES